MTRALLQRQAALAAVAMLVTVGALALGHREEPAAPVPPVDVGIRWQRAVVGVLAPRSYVGQSACGLALDSGTLGVAHPLLPCGVDLVVAYRNKEVRTEVVDQRPVEPGREFDLTQALADELGVRGTQRIRWRFAG